MTAFDFLHDPRTVFVERLLAIRVSRRLAASAIALATVIGIVGLAWSIEHARALDAERSVVRLRAEDVALRARIAGERLEAAEIADLGALDGRLRAIASSGSRLRSRMAALAEELPRDVWLVSLTDDGRRVTLVGRTQRLKSVADAMRRLSGERLGTATLVRVARLERPSGALLEFSFSIGAR